MIFVNNTCSCSGQRPVAVQLRPVPIHVPVLLPGRGHERGQHLAVQVRGAKGQGYKV